MKLVINRETGINKLVFANKPEIILDNAKISYPYFDKNNMIDKSLVDIVFDTKEYKKVPVEYVGEDKLDINYIEKHLG